MMDDELPPEFSRLFHDQFEALLTWRRDVRRFLADPIPEPLIESLLDLAQLAPSVGNSQPWRFVRVDGKAARKAIRANFERCNEKALAGYAGDQAKIYASLKLSGLDDAPLQLAVFCDEATDQGDGLGQGTMPETLVFSVVGAVHLLWLAARAQGLGLGWVSILEPAEVKQSLDVPETWRLVAYLCLGWPQELDTVPELERLGWQSRTNAGRKILKR
jgi:5,6-dimethylbenzimidazole synthase